MKHNVTHYTVTGATKEAYALPEELFGAKINQELMAVAVRIYLGNQRQATSHAQTRGEVNRTGKKLYRQKGTGGARHGSRKAPIFVGGGKAHGPKGNENYKRTLSPKMKRAALISALSQTATNTKVAVISGLDKLEAKSKAMQTLVTSIAKDAKKPLLILDKPFANVLKAGTNLKTITLTQALRLNTFEILNHDFLFFTPEAVDLLKFKYAVTKKAVTITPAKTKVEPKAEKKTAKTKRSSTKNINKARSGSARMAK